MKLKLPTSIHLFKVNNRNAKKMHEMCSKLTIKATMIDNNKERQWRRSVVFIIDFEQISHIALVFLLLTLNK